MPTRPGSRHIHFLTVDLCLASVWRRSSCSPLKPSGFSLHCVQRTFGCLGRSYFALGMTVLPSLPLVLGGSGTSFLMRSAASLGWRTRDLAALPFWRASASLARSFSVAELVDFIDTLLSLDVDRSIEIER